VLVDSETEIEAILSGFEVVARGLDSKQLTDALVDAITIVESDAVSVVALVGGAASGKTVLAQAVVAAVRARNRTADVISTDDFVVGDRERRRQLEKDGDARAKYDFAFLDKVVASVRAHEVISVPQYDDHTGVAVDSLLRPHRIGDLDVLIVEGDFLEVVDPDLVIFLHVPDSIRLHNRLHRDVRERSAVDTAEVESNFRLRQHTQHIPFTLPAATAADIIVRSGVDANCRSYDIYRPRVGR
jgi:uridine kinase